MIAIWAMLFLPSANCQVPQTPGFPTMPLYEERDTLVKYEDGLYLEKWFINRIRIDEGYVFREKQEKQRRADEEEKSTARIDEMERKLKEKEDKNPKQKEAKKPPNSTDKG
jgi:hypothetical protein